MNRITLLMLRCATVLVGLACASRIVGSVSSYGGYSVITGTSSTARKLQVGARLSF